MGHLTRHTVNDRHFEIFEIDGEWFWHQTHQRLVDDRLIDVVVPGAYGPFESERAAYEHALEILGPPHPNAVIAEGSKIRDE